MMLNRKTYFEILLLLEKSISKKVIGPFCGEVHTTLLMLKNYVAEQKDLFQTCKALEIIKSHSKNQIYRSTSAEGDLCLTETMLEGR